MAGSATPPITRRDDRRRTRRIGALGACSAALVILGGSFSHGREANAAPLSAAAAPDGTRTVTLLDLSATPTEIEIALRKAGIANETTGFTTGPSRVGTIVAIQAEQDPSQRGVVAHGHTLALPPGYAGTVRLSVGIAARPGSHYDQPSDPFAAREPLAGLARDVDNSTLLATARAKGLAVTVTDMSGAALSADPPPSRERTVVFMTAAKELVIRVA